MKKEVRTVGSRTIERYRLRSLRPGDEFEAVYTNDDGSHFTQPLDFVCLADLLFDDLREGGGITRGSDPTPVVAGVHLGGDGCTYIANESVNFVRLQRRGRPRDVNGESVTLTQDECRALLQLMVELSGEDLHGVIMTANGAADAGLLPPMIRSIVARIDSVADGEQSAPPPEGGDVAG